MVHNIQRTKLSHAVFVVHSLSANVFRKLSVVHYNLIQVMSHYYVTSSTKRGLIADPNCTHLEFLNSTCEFSTTLKLGPNIPLT